MQTGKKPKSTIIMIEFAGNFSFEKETKNFSDTQKNLS